MIDVALMLRKAKKAALSVAISTLDSVGNQVHKAALWADKVVANIRTQYIAVAAEVEKIEQELRDLNK